MTNWPPRHPIAALILAALLAGFSLLGIHRLKLDSSLASLFPRNDPAAAALDKTLNDFSAADDLLLLASLPPGKSDPQSLLDFAGRLEARMKSSPAAMELSSGIVYRTDSQTEDFFKNVMAPAGIYYLSDEEFAAARRRLTRPEMAAQIRQDETMLSAPGPQAGALARVLLEDPLRLREFISSRWAQARPMETLAGSDAFLSKDGRSLLILVPGNKPPSDLDFCRQFTATISSIAEGANSDGLKLDYTGAYAIAAASQRSIRREMIQSVIGSVICLQLLFIAAYRRPIRLFALAFGPVAVGIVYGFGFYGVFGHQITPMTAAIGGILAGMGIDYSIQYLSLYQSGRLEGKSPVDAATAAITLLGRPLLAAWATSAIGFLAIGASSIGAVRDFAILGTLGLAGAFFGSVFILPAVLVLTDRRPAQARFSIAPLLGLVYRWRRICMAAVLLVFLTAGAVLIASGRLLPPQASLDVMHPRPNPPLDALDLLASKRLLPETMIVHLQAQNPRDLLDLAQQVKTRLATPAMKQAGIARTFGLADLLPDQRIVTARRAAIDPSEPDRVANDFRAVIAASAFDAGHFQPYARFLHDLLARPAAPTIHDLIAYPSLAGRVLPRQAMDSPNTPPTEAITLVFLKPAGADDPDRKQSVAAIRSALDELPGATLTGLAVVGQDAADSIRRDLPRLILAALAAVAIYLLFHFRNLIDPLLTLLPTLFSLAILLAAMRLTGQKLNMMNLVAFPLLIGIDVDYGIFLVSLARMTPSTGRATRSAGVSTSPSPGVPGEGDRDLLGRLAASGHAVLMCAAATTLGFGSLISASVPAARSLGIAVAIGVVACLLCALFLLAPILITLSQPRGGRSSP